MNRWGRRLRTPVFFDGKVTDLIDGFTHFKFGLAAAAKAEGTVGAEESFGGGVSQTAHAGDAMVDIGTENGELMSVGAVPLEVADRGNIRALRREHRRDRKIDGTATGVTNG